MIDGMRENVDKPRGPMTLFLTSRVVRRRVAFVVLATPMLYVLSFGPACWMTSQDSNAGVDMQMPPRWMRIYWPVGKIVRDPQLPANRLFRWWMTLGVPDSKLVSVPTQADGEMMFVVTPAAIVP